MAEVDTLHNEGDECHGLFTCLTGGYSSKVLIKAACCFLLLVYGLHYTTTR